MRTGMTRFAGKLKPVLFELVDAEGVAYAVLAIAFAAVVPVDRIGKLCACSVRLPINSCAKNWGADLAVGPIAYSRVAPHRRNDLGSKVAIWRPQGIGCLASQPHLERFQMKCERGERHSQII